MMLIEFTRMITWGDATRENGWLGRIGIIPVENNQPAPGKLSPYLIHTVHVFK